MYGPSGHLSHRLWERVGSVVDRMGVGVRLLAARLPAILVGVLVGTPAAADGPLSPDQAVQRAIELSPAVATAQRAVDLARGERAATRVFLYNPQANWQFQFPGTTDYLAVQAYQPFSLSGEGWFARAAARHALDASEAALVRARFVAAADARRAWADAASALARADVAEQVAGLSAGLVDAMRRRYAAGDASQLDLRLMQLARVQAEVAALELSGEAATALARLAELVQEPIVADRIAHDPLLAAPLPSRPPPDDRSDVIAARDTLAQAESELSRARAAAVPPFWLGVNYAGDDNGFVVGPYMQWDFPVFDRNQIARGDAVGRVGEAEATWLSTTARREVEVRTSRDRVARGETVLPMSTVQAQEEARDALEGVMAAFEAGEFDLATAVAFRQQVLGGLDAIFRLRHAIAVARIDLLLAVEDPALLGEAP